MGDNIEFATTILTSTSPRDVANFIPHSLDLSQTLIEKNLAVWFSNYTKMLIRYNQDLNLLVANGRDFFTTSGAEFGSIDKIWNCVASCVTSQIASNDALIKTMKNDILPQLAGAVRDDVRFSELLVNSRELMEISRALDNNDPNGEYQWNVKAPAVLDNFENFKRHEKGLLSSSFLGYMNALNTKTSEMLHKNENAVNYILKEFDVDKEMTAYMDYMVHAKVQAPEGTFGASQGSSSRTASSSGISPLKNRPSRASVSSGTSTDTKKKSKLRSKMGSLLGRKKKNEKHSAAPVEAIPEDDSASPVTSRQTNSFSTRRSFADQQPQHTQPQSPPKPAQTERGAFGVAGGNGSSASGPFGGASSSGIRSQTFSETVPLQPSAPAKQEDPLLASQERSPVHEAEPNVVKYSSSDDDSDGPTDALGNRLSMLQTHQLDHPPKVDADDEDRSRKTSSGKYSFDYGDEEKDLSARATPRTDTATDFPTFGAPPSSSANGAQAGSLSNLAPTSAAATSIANEVGPPANPPKDATLPGDFRSSVSSDAAGFGTSAPQAQTQPPPPPPSRKVHTTDKINRRDLHSGTFQNLPQARESFIQPRAHQDEVARPSLVSQNTGNSFFRHDSQFKHFGTTQALVNEGLHSSVAEIINVTYQGGDVTKAQVLGEVAFNYNSANVPNGSQEILIPVHFTKSLLNESFFRQVGDTNYSLDLSQVASRTLGGLKYIADLNETQVPVLVRQVWKFEPHQASLIIKLSHNGTYAPRVQLDGLVISASLSSNVESISASSKPEGSFNKDKNRITWRYSQPLVLDVNKPEEKLIARFQTNGQATEAPTGVQLKFNVVDSPTAYVPILDSEGHNIPSFRSLSTGNYVSHA